METAMGSAMKSAMGAIMENAAAEQELSQEQRTARGTKASIVGIVLNVCLCVGKGIIGWLAGSVSIVADAINNLSDAASNIISLFGFKLAGKPADADHPSGHGRYEYLSGLMVAVLILVIGVELLKSSVEKIINPSPVEFSVALVVVLALAIAVKLWMMVYNHRVGKEIGSTTLEAASVDSRNDVITTAAVLLASLIGYFTNINLDAWMGLAVSAFILWSGVGLVKDTIDPLLGSPASPELVDRIAKRALSYEGILGIHDLLVHDYGPGRMFASLHAEVAAEVDVLKSHELIDKIEADFREYEGMEVVIHLDPIVTSDPRVREMRGVVSEIVHGIDARLSIHDFRIVPGENRTNLIFDCVLPYDVNYSEAEIKKLIAERVREQYPQCCCVIQVDRSFVAS